MSTAAASDLIRAEFAEAYEPPTWASILRPYFQKNLGMRSDRLLDHVIHLAAEAQGRAMERMRVTPGVEFDAAGGLIEFVRNWHNQPVRDTCVVGMQVWRRFYMRPAPAAVATGAGLRTRSTRSKRKPRRGRRR